MCKIHNPRKIDKCMVNLLDVLKHGTNYKVVACCCGHRRYPMTIVCKATKNGQLFELMHMIDLPRKKRAYVKDKQGYYYIPETIQ